MDAVLAVAETAFVTGEPGVFGVDRDVTPEHGVRGYRINGLSFKKKNHKSTPGSEPEATTRRDEMLAP